MHHGSAPASLPVVLGLTRSPRWEDRRTAARGLGSWINERDVRDRLVELLDDDDLAVGKAAADVLVRDGGTDGLRRVVRRYATLDDQVGAHVGLVISAALGDRLADALRDLLAHDPDEETVAGIGDLAAYLGLDV